MQSLEEQTQLLKTLPFGEAKEIISKEQIAEKISVFAQMLDRDYAHNELLIISIMKGALCLTADLIRAMKSDPSLQYIRCSSYGQNGTDRGPLEITGMDTISVQGKNVLIVDDICDSGHTLNAVRKQILQKEPANVRSLVLLRRKTNLPTKFLPDYSLFEVEQDDFVVGYGLDYKEHFRSLPSIYALPSSKSRNIS